MSRKSHHLKAECDLEQACPLVGDAKDQNLIETKNNEQQEGTTNTTDHHWTKNKHNNRERRHLRTNSLPSSSTASVLSASAQRHHYGTRSSRTNNDRNHIRVHSNSHPTASSPFFLYGSLEDISEDHVLVTPLPHPLPPGVAGAWVDRQRRFSPRSELLALAHSLSSGSADSNDDDSIPEEKATTNENVQSFHLSFFPHKSGLSSSMSTSSNSSGILGGLRKPESISKIHRRQKTVESLMDDIKGVEQPAVCRDVVFAILFYLQIISVILLGMKFGPLALSHQGDDSKIVMADMMDSMSLLHIKI